MKCFRLLVMLLSLGMFPFRNTALADSNYEDYTFTTFAGSAESGPGWRDGFRSSARFYSPVGTAVDDNSNVYVADWSNSTIRKINSSGTVTTLAGFSGRTGSMDGVGAAARFLDPYGIAVDHNHNVYVADTGNSAIRKIMPDGTVTTFAGLMGVPGSANGTGSGARFGYPYGIAVDQNNNIYVADTYNHTIRKITPGGTVTTMAGTAGQAGSLDAKGTAARFKYPVALAVDNSGNIYVAENDNSDVRRISPAGDVTTLAGSAGNVGYADGTGSSARFQYPKGIAVGSDNNVYVADTFNEVIRKITAAGDVSTFAGAAGITGNTDGTGTNAQFYNPFGIAADGNGNLFIGDYNNDDIRRIDIGTAAVTTYAGLPSNPGSQDGAANMAQFKYPSGTAVDSAGNVYVADFQNSTIRRITPSGQVTTFAGTAGQTGTNDATGGSARFNQPLGVAVDHNDNVYVADRFNHAIRKITPIGVVTTLAGLPGTSGTNDGTGTDARFYQPFALALDSSNNIYVADTQNHTLRKITPAGLVTTLAGSAGIPGTNDGLGVAARFHFPEGVAVDSSGNVFVVDEGNYSIRKIAPDGNVTTFAGFPGVTGSSDGTGSSARFTFPLGLAIDSGNNLYVGDTGNNLVRKITSAGVVTTLAGSSLEGANIDGTGNDARFSSPEGLSVDGSGNIYMADTGNHVIRKGYPNVLSDRPMIDISAGAVGQIRHLSVSNSTATSRLWSFIRYPAGSSAQLSSTNGTNPTFTPDVEDIYVIRFQAWDNSGHTTIRTLTIYADNTAPTAIFTNAFSGMTWSNAVLTVKGIANDNLQLSNVWVQVNNGSWTLANGLSAWSYNANLTPGTNVIRVYATDASGLVSTTNTVNINYIVSAPIDFQITGGGTVTPNYSNAVLEIGKSYTVTAKPPVGYLFVNWTGTNGTVLSTSATYTFVMATNLVLHANFMLNPFVAGQGTFAGLFYDTNGITAANAGYFTAKLTSKGTFSAKLTLSGASVSVGGTVSAGGAFSNSVALKTGGSLTLQLQFDLGNDAVSGTVANSGAGWTSQLQGFRNVYSKTNLSALGGKRFSVVIPGATDASVAPGGYSYGSALVSTMGGVTFSGVLADGSKATQKTYMSKQGKWPFFISPYAGKGLMIGWLTVSNQVNSDLSGTVNWIKLPIAGARYPNGFQITTNAVGSFYTFTSGVPVLNLPSGGVAILAQGDLSQNLTNTFTMDATSKVTSGDGLSMTITTATGLFKGTAPNPATGGSVPFTGVILQKQNAGFGNFQGATQSGRVYVGE